MGGMQCCTTYATRRYCSCLEQSARTGRVPPPGEWPKRPFSLCASNVKLLHGSAGRQRQHPPAGMGMWGDTESLMCNQGHQALSGSSGIRPSLSLQA